MHRNDLTINVITFVPEYKQILTENIVSDSVEYIKVSQHINPNKLIFLFVMLPIDTRHFFTSSPYGKLFI